MSRSGVKGYYSGQGKGYWGSGGESNGLDVHLGEEIRFDNGLGNSCAEDGERPIRDGATYLP